MTTSTLRGLGWAILVSALLCGSACKGCRDTSSGNGADEPDVGAPAPDAAVAGDECVDQDDDGFGVGLTCDGAVDCNDEDPAINPDVEEACDDEVDNDCDGTIDEGCPDCDEGETRECGTDEGACEKGTQSCRDNMWTECEGATEPGDEVCDGVDNDCDGNVDENPDLLCNDGLGCNGVEMCENGACTAEPVDCSHLDGPCVVGVCSDKDGGCVAMPKTNGDSCDDGNFCTVDGTCNAGVCETQPRDCSGVADQCNEGVCDETADACVAVPVSDGTTCDDGQFCTVGESCTAGACTGEARDCSAAADQCNSGTCDETADACVPAALPDGTTCDDGAYCTVNDACVAGACTAGGPRQCGAAGGSCRDGVCDEATKSCTGDPVADGTPCDDDQYCTTGDACVAGTCTGTTPRDCSGVATPCKDGICNEALNACATAAKADGTTCDDGRFCTDADVCTAGTCGGSARSCAASTDACNDGVCNESAGACVARPKSDGLNCDDGQYCTVADTCTAGACGGPARDCSMTVGVDQCNAGSCDEGADACALVPRMDGTTCSDGDLCTTADACLAGSCEGTPKPCTGDQCNDSACDPTTGMCATTPKANGTTCDDGVNCTVTDVCTNGACGGTTKTCTQLDGECVVGMCEETNGNCVATNKMDGSSCTDNDACTMADSCTNGVCAGTTMDCSGMLGTDDCNIGVCDPLTGCTLQQAMDGTACDDNDACTSGTTCAAGVCGGGSTVTCDSMPGGDECHYGTCDPQSGCVLQTATNGSTCDDGDACTSGETCTNGTCGGGSMMSCAMFDTPCTIGMCSGGTCSAQPRNEGSSCEDGDLCTTGETCTNGACDGGTTMNCDAFDGPCSIGVCNAGVCSAQPINPGDACDDGDDCTVGETCTNGSCGGGTPMVCDHLDSDCASGVCVSGACTTQPINAGGACDDGDDCTTGSTCTNGSCGGGSMMDCSHLDSACAVGVCNGGACTTQTQNEGLGCDDLDKCTTGDTCTAGTCAGTAVTCTDGECHTSACNPATGACVDTPKADDTPCNDSDLCTTGDVCTGGICIGGAANCADQDDCNIGSCDPSSGNCVQTPRGDGAPCDDSNLCTDGDSCVSGICNPGAPRSCTAPNCMIAVCDPDTGCGTIPDPDPMCCADNTIDNDLDGAGACDDCDDANGSVYPGATERCNGIDDDCDEAVDEGVGDFDNDGWSICGNDPALLDCNDSNPNVNPGQLEICDNGIDDNCDGYACESCSSADADNDGFSECESDCDDSDPTVYPDAPELCDNKDNDCNENTRQNCGISQTCNYDGDRDPTNDVDTCRDDMICAEVFSGNGPNSSLGFRCTSWCNWSATGARGDGCEANQTCSLDLLRSGNIHGCNVNTATPGTVNGGGSCSRDSDCRSLLCTKGALKYCVDYCSADSYCAPGATCRLSHQPYSSPTSTADADGLCYPSTSGSGTGVNCSFDSNCRSRACVTDPNNSSDRYCTQLCCQDSHCPSGYTCSLGGIAELALASPTTVYIVPPDADAPSCTDSSQCTGEGGICSSGKCTFRIYETAGQCIKDVSGQGTARAGQACNANADCESNFCEKDLGVCVEVCCSDASCPTGLGCELMAVETKTDQATYARVCVNLSSDDTLERK